MIQNHTRSRLALNAGATAALALLLCACVADGQQRTSDASGAQPRQANYECGASGRLQIENHRTRVRLVEPDGSSHELPASPPGQASRYGAPNAALVLEGREALWMRAGREPLTCRR